MAYKLKYILTTISIMLCLFLFGLLSFNKGITEYRGGNSHPKLVEITQKSAQFIDPALSKLLFLDYGVIKNNDKYYAVITKKDNILQVVSLGDVFYEVILFSNLPLFLLLLVAFTIPYLNNRMRAKKNQQALIHINDDIDDLLSKFKLELPPIAQQNQLSKISQALVILNQYVSAQHQQNIRFTSQDKLTGLADRHTYIEHLQHCLTNNKNLQQGLLFIDLDGFKQVNDSFGHSFGDEVLLQVAQRLNTVVRHNQISKIDTLTQLELNLSRLGGDEFSIFIETIRDQNHIVEVAKNVLNEIERDFVLGNKIIKIGASIGIATYPDSASTPHMLLQMADVAMYRAKIDGRGIYRVYSPEMGNKLRRHHYLLEEIRLAIASQSFHLSFQPIVRVDDCSIDYFECLIRWNHPTEGPISPTEFIPIAEESNLIIELGNWILFEACRQMAAWYNAGMNKVRISVNISGVQLKHVPLYDWVTSTIDKVGLPASALLLEITESCFIDASESVINDLEKLRARGVLIAMDDFGTGFSSLSTLANLPVDVIKIDKLFIGQATINPKYHKILNSISDLGKNLDLKIVVEGVEVASQFELVKKLGIHCIQGYLISRPETSRDLGNNMISKNLNHIAMTGTGVYPRPQTKSTNYP